MNKEFDAFISYANEDKETFVLQLAQKLRSIGLKIWFDEFCLKVGDNLREKIDFGLSNSKYGIVILSHNFFAKQWPQKELNALYSLEVDGQSVILPVWKDIGRNEIRKYSPLLADKFAAQAYEGIDKVTSQLVEVIDPANDYPNQLLQKTLEQNEPKKYPEFDIRVNWKKDFQVLGENPYYKKDKTYVVIEVSNWGKREVVISKVGLHVKRKEKPFILAVDSLFWGPRRLKDGDRGDYMVEQDAIGDLDLVDYAWAMDQVGREWRSS